MAALDAVLDKDTQAFVEQYKGLNSNGKAVLAAAANALVAYSRLESSEGKEQQAAEHD